MKKLILVCDVLLFALLIYSAAFGSPFCSSDVYNDTEEDAWAICGGDFDGDGYIDIALADHSSNGKVTIHLNYYNDTPGVFNLDSTYQVGPNPYSVEAGLLDNDNHLDLAVACDSFFIILWGDGEGKFGSPHKHQLEDGYKRLCLADLNDDGCIDIGVSNEETGYVTVWINDCSSRGFADSTGYEVGGDPAKVIAADLDNDGNLDLALGNATSIDSLPILWNDGDGGFDSITYADLPSWCLQQPLNLTAIDVDGNVCLDLAYACWLGECVQVMKQVIIENECSGTFTVNENDFYVVSREPTCIIAKDLDGDGKDELITGNYDWPYFHVLWNQGDTYFEVEKVTDIHGGYDCTVIFSDNLNNDTLGTNDLAIGQCIDKQDPESPAEDLVVLLNDWYHWYRGDVDCDDDRDISDISYLQNYLFQSGPEPCNDPPGSEIRGDVNCDGQTTVSDLVFLINYVLKSGPAPCCPL